MNPILVDVLRGDFVESSHRGAIYVVDDNGQELMSVGDVGRLTYPRSAIKIMQALPVIESGAADSLRLNDKQLSLICSSHNGEVRHTAMATSILQAAKLNMDDLECGAHWPKHHEPTEHALIKSGKQPCALHNNCSGKHSGMLAYAKHAGFDTKGYINIDHPVQVVISKIMSDLAEHDLTSAPCGLDGCSLPTWAASLTGWAKAFAKISRGKGLGATRATAFAKLQNAVMAEPFYVAGSGRYCTEIMTKLSTPIFVKTGAEGVFCVSLPEHGIGIALKCEDGLTRGAEMMLSATLKKLGVLNTEDNDIINQFTSKILTNCNQLEVAKIQPSAFWDF